MKSALLLAPLLAWLSPAPPARADVPRYDAAGPWEVIQTSENIVVQRRKVPGSAIHEFQGRAIVPAPLATVLAVLEDQAKHASGKEECQGELEPSADSSVRSAVVYDRTKAPWPVAERDVVLRADTALDPVGREVRVDFVTTELRCLPPIHGVVRMPYMRGHYLLRPVEGGRATDVEYQVHADPGGALPRWAIHMAARKIPYDTLRNLRSSSTDPSHEPTARAIRSRPEYQQLMTMVAKIQASAN